MTFKLLKDWHTPLAYHVKGSVGSDDYWAKTLGMSTICFLQYWEEGYLDGWYEETEPIEDKDLKVTF